MNNIGDLSPARYARVPPSPQIVLCAPLLVSIVLSIFPLAESTTFQMSLSNDGTNSVLPSGVAARRSQPCGSSLPHSVFSVTRSTQWSVSGVVKWSLRVTALATTPLILRGFAAPLAVVG